MTSYDAFTSEVYAVKILAAKLMYPAKNTNNIESLFDDVAKFLVTLDQLYLVTLDQLYKDGDVKKRQIVGSIFPEKLVFDGSYYLNFRILSHLGDQLAYYIFKPEFNFRWVFAPSVIS